MIRISDKSLEMAIIKDKSRKKGKKLSRMMKENVMREVEIYEQNRKNV